MIFGKVIETLPADFNRGGHGKLVHRFPVSRFSSARHSLAWYYVQKRRRISIQFPQAAGLSSSYDQVVSPLMMIQRARMT